MARGQDGVELDVMLVKRDRLCYVQDVRVVKGMRKGLSDYHMICKVMLSGD